jgi:hypothetical protein
MITPLDPATLTGPAQKIFQGPPKMREMAAKGVALGVMPADLVLLLVALLQTGEPPIAETAEKTLGNLPPQVLTGALGANLAPLAIHHLATRYHARLDVLSALVSMPNVDAETIYDVAKVCGEEASELLATNEERLLSNPRIIEALYLNRHTRMSTADRIVELAVRNDVEVNLPAWKEAAAAIQNELIIDTGGEPTPDDLLFAQNIHIAESLRSGDEIEEVVEISDDPNAEDKVKEKYEPLYRKIALMTNSQKIRFATVGTPEAILILVSDPSPLVSSAAAKSPQINEAVVEQCAKRRNISSEVLTTFGQRADLLRRLSTKRDLIKNPKTPPSLAMKLISHFQPHELERLASDRNVSGSVRQIIKNYLERKKR